MTEAIKDDDQDKITVEKVEDAFREADIAVEKIATPAKKADKSIVTAQEGLEELRRKLAGEASARQDAERRAQQAAQDAFKARTEADTYGSQMVDGTINALKSSKAALREAYKQALANQDFDRAAEVQDEMSMSAARLAQLETTKQAMANRPKQAPPALVPSDPVEAFVAGRTQPTADWVRAHPEYVRDSRLFNKMVAAHELAVADGFRPDTDEYFREVEGTLKINRGQDQDEVQAAQPVQRRSSPAAAPVSRSGTAPGSNPRVVRLTADEIEMAQMSGITPEEYAKNKMALKAEDRLH